MMRGEIWWADFGIPFGSEPGFKRPVLIVQNDSFTESKINTVIVVPLTTNTILADAPGNVLLKRKDSKLSKDSVIVVSQITVLDKDRLIEKELKISKKIVEEVECGIRLILAIEN
jgi:mRNA interferase MazF